MPLPPAPHQDWNATLKTLRRDEAHGWDELLVMNDIYVKGPTDFQGASGWRGGMEGWQGAVAPGRGQPRHSSTGASILVIFLRVLARGP